MFCLWNWWRSPIPFTQHPPHELATVLQHLLVWKHRQWKYNENWKQSLPFRMHIWEQTIYAISHPHFDVLSQRFKQILPLCFQKLKQNQDITAISQLAFTCPGCSCYHRRVLCYNHWDTISTEYSPNAHGLNLLTKVWHFYQVLAIPAQHKTNMDFPSGRKVPLVLESKTSGIQGVNS